jgi:hypothetical protein
MPSTDQPEVQPTLLFIPDISGFTNFVNANEIQHSRHIIEELLEVLIDANEMDLQISEIEGDAILFYRQGAQPTAAEILAQVQRMYVRFHAHLRKYDTHRICQCGACSTASGLALKFVLHYGDLATKRVKEFSKLFGKDLIVAHRLMKNDIQTNEYVLLTHQLLNMCSAWVEIKQVAWDEAVEGEGTYDDVLVKYCYLALEPLAVHIPEPRIEDYSVKGADAKALQVEGIVNAPMNMVFDVVSDVSFRDAWIGGLSASGELNGKITKNGSTHRCVMSGTDNDPFFISHRFKMAQEVITWVETDHKAKWNVVIKLERIGKQLTRVYYTFFVKSDLISRMKFKYKVKKPMAAWVSGNFKTLNEYCSGLLQEGKQHPAHVTLDNA